MLFSVFIYGGVLQAQELTDCDDLPTQERRERCEELKAIIPQLQAEIQEGKVLLGVQKKKSASISQNIQTLEAKIQKHQASIQARRIAIESLSGSIAERKAQLEELRTRIRRSEENLAEMIRRSDVKDEVSIVEIVLGSNTFSDFFTDLDQMRSLRDELQRKLQIIQEARILTKSKTKKLVAEKLEEQKMKEVQLFEKRKIAELQDEKEVDLMHSKTQESFHQRVIQQRQEEIAQIRSALFALRDANTSINFGQAYEIAKQVQNYTGVRPAFLLAILTQESRIGKNVGRCNVSSTPNRMWDDIMPGPNDNSWRNDQAVYVEIMDSLGLKPEDKPLSCPLSAYGWGGAMGPAQFIPTTWIAVAPEVSRATGSNPPNPWNPRDAFFASGIFLSQLGAGAGTTSAEIEAAGRYYAGGNWQTRGMVYARSVQNIANQMETNIRVLEQE